MAIQRCIVMNNPSLQCSSKCSFEQCMVNKHKNDKNASAGEYLKIIPPILDEVEDGTRIRICVRCRFDVIVVSVRIELVYLFGIVLDLLLGRHGNPSVAHDVRWFVGIPLSPLATARLVNHIVHI